MRKGSRLLLSGDGATDSPEVVCLQLGDNLPELELGAVVVPRDTLDKRPLPHPWDRKPEQWHARFKGAEWVWTTRTFGRPRVMRNERLVLRRYFGLPSSALNRKMHVTVSAVGGLRMYLDGEAVGQPKDGPEGADNFYAEFDGEHEIKGKKPEHVMEFHVKRTVGRPQKKGVLPAGGLIYALEVTWEEETKADVIKRFVDAWFGAVTSRFFRVVGLLGFLACLVLALSPWLDAATRTVCATFGAALLGAWLSPRIRTESKAKRGQRKQE